MTTIQVKLKNFTPVIDQIVEDLGLLPAVVFGAVWRYCQMDDRVCKASQKKLAKRAGASTKTVQRALKKLVEAGYLVDKTPDLRHAPHVYADTGKASFIGALAAQIDNGGKSESPTEVGQRVLPVDRGRSESPTEVGQRVLPRSVRESCKDTYKDTIQDRNNVAAAVEQLIQFDIDPMVAATLATTEPLENIVGWIEYAKAQTNLQNPPGFVVKRLKEKVPVPIRAEPERKKYTVPECESEQDSVALAEPSQDEIVWNQTKDELKLQMGRNVYSRWIGPTQVLERTNGVWRIDCGNEFVRDWLENRLRGTVERTLAHVVGGPVEIEFVVTGGATC